MKKNVFRILISLTLLIAVVALSLTLCSCQKISELTGVKYDKEKQVVSWDKAAAAETYNVIVDGVKQLSTSETSSEVEVPDNTGKDVTVEIQAVDSEGTLLATGDIELKVLPVLMVEVKDDNFDWSASAGSVDSKNGTVAYKLVYDGEEVADLISDTTYPVGSGAHTLKVKAVYTDKDNYYSNYSVEAKASLLSIPDNIQFDNETITWGAVDFLDEEINYSLFINGEKYPEEIHHNYVTLKELGITTTDILSISVQAVSKKENIKSSVASSDVTFKKVKQIEKLEMKDGILTWDEIPDAQGYRIELNGIEKETTETNEYSGFVSGGSYSVRVRAIAKDATYTYGDWSEAKAVSIVNTPIVRFANPNVYWDEVNNNNGYEINICKVDEKGVLLKKLDPISVNGTIFNVSNVCKDIGIYTLTVKAKALSEVDDKETGYYDSKESTVKTIVKLGKPTKLTVEESISTAPGGSISFTINDVSEGANYVLKIEGSEVSSTNGVSFTLPKPISSYVSQEDGKSDMKVSIEAVPTSLTENNNKIYLPASEKLEFTLSQLAIPVNVSLTTEGNRLCWEENSTVKAIGGGYGIYLGDLNIVETNTYLLPKLNPGIYNLQVFSKAPGMKEQLGSEDDILNNSTYTYEEGKELTIYLSSDLSPVITVKKLEAVTNFRIENNSFSWNPTPTAYGYRVDIVTEKEGAVQYTYGIGAKNKYEDENARFAGMYLSNNADFSDELNFNEAGIIQVKAMGNAGLVLKGYDTIILDSDYASITPENIVERLAAPLGLKFEGETVSWNTVPYAESYGVYLSEGGSTYVISIDDSTSCSMADYGAHQYSIVVRALGDGKNYLDSVDSEPLTFRKLKKIEEGKLYVKDEYYFWAYEEGTTSYNVTIASTSGDAVIDVIDREDIEVAKNTYMCKCGYKLIKSEFDALPAEWKCPDCESAKTELFQAVQFIPKFNQKSNPQVTIYALGDGKLYMNSQKNTFVQRTVRLSAPVDPDIKCKVSYDEDGAKELIFTSGIVNPLENGGYTFTVAGINYNVDGKDAVLTYKATGSTTYDVTVGYKGNVFQKDSLGNIIYYYNSGVSITATTISCLNDVSLKNSNISRNPTIPTEGTETVKYSISWNAIDGAQYCCYWAVYNKAAYESAADGEKPEAVVTSDYYYSGVNTAYSATLKYADYVNKGYLLEFNIRTIGDEDSEGFGTMIASQKFISKTADLVNNN